jgi:hypothetical protein
MPSSAQKRKKNGASMLTYEMRHHKQYNVKKKALQNINWINAVMPSKCGMG